jgi:hypothetical protein
MSEDPNKMQQIPGQPNENLFGTADIQATDTSPTTFSTREDFVSKDTTQTTVSIEKFEQLEKKVSDLEGSLNKAEDNFEKGRYDLITLLGVFVGLITYLGLEIQVFKTIEAPLLVVGISIFFIASLLLFILTMNVILKKLDTTTWRDFKTPLYPILIVLLLISIGLIAFASCNNLNLFGINLIVSK